MEMNTSQNLQQIENGERIITNRKTFDGTTTTSVTNPFYHEHKNMVITTKFLVELMEKKKTEAVAMLNVLGNINGLAYALHIDLRYGIFSENKIDLSQREEIFGKNYIPPAKPTTFIELMWDAFQDLTVIVLSVAGLISLILGISIGEHKDTDWIEGFSVLMAVLIVVFVTALNDYQKEKQFRALNEIKEDEKIKVIRDGECKEISKFQIVVGDIVRIELGDILPADGILFDDKNVKVDESTMTGESMLVTKNETKDPFLLSGTKIMEGVGKMLVICVGENSQGGIITKLIQHNKSPEESSTKAKVNKSESPKESHGRVKSRKLSEQGSFQNNIMPLNPNDENEPKETSYMTMVTPATTMTQSFSGKADKPTDNNGITNYDTFPPTATNKSRPTSAIPDNGTVNVENQEKQEKGEESMSPLQGKLNKLTVTIGKLGTVMALIVFVALCLRFSIETFGIDKKGWEGKYANVYLKYFITAITVLVVAIPEGLPLAVTIALAYSVRKMLKDNNLVRHLDACETMGSATTICSDKTGTLTRNRMTVMKLWYGNKEFSPLPSANEISDYSKLVLCEGICMNSTAEILPPKQAGGEPEHTGNKTECALLQLAKDLGYNYTEIRRNGVIEKMNTFNSAKKRMSVIIKPANEDRTSNKYRLYVKGATEVILDLCTHFLSLEGDIKMMNDQNKIEITKNVIEKYATEGMRTICLAYRDIELEAGGNNTSISTESLECHLTCISIFGIEDPVRPEVPGAISICKDAGIVVRMVTGDNIITARSIALKCGIIHAKDKSLVMEGSEFRKRVINEKTNTINQKEFDKIWPSLRILARSTPKDKYTLVMGIMKSNLPAYGPQVVAVTGDGTNDAPALKRANVGFAMGISGTSVAKDASDIILMDDNFTSIVNAVKWGRSVYDNISKFLQFQLTVNIVAISIAVIGAVTIEQSPLTAVQLLWVNLIMDTFASLALATEQPTRELLLRKPYSRSKPLLSKSMTKHIIGQSIYQLVVLLVLIYKGHDIMDIENGKEDPGSSGNTPSTHYTMVFNTFVWMQLFNEWNSRKIHDEMNIFAGIMSNYTFISIVIFQIATQILIVEFGDRAFSTTHLTSSQWGICLLLAFVTLPLGALLRLVNTKELPRWMAIGRDSMHISPAQPKTGQELWVRGMRRLRNQIRVVNAFKAGIDSVDRLDAIVKSENEECDLETTN